MVLISTTVAVTALAVAISALLVVITNHLHRTSARLADSVESLRLADEAEIDLLLHSRAHDPVLRVEMEQRLTQKLTEMRRFVTTSKEAQLLREIDSQLEQYVGSGETEAAVAFLDDTYKALEAFEEVNVEQSRAARERAARSDILAKWVGITGALTLLGLAGWLLWWLRLRVFRPIFALANSIERFTAGDRQARAAEDGPQELRETARRFNDMAAALAAQREAQMGFVGGVAHDLRNPLAALKLSLATIHPDKPLPPEPRVRKALAMADRQLNSLDRMTSDLLDTAKIEAGRLELEPQWRDARDLVREVLELFELSASERRVEAQLPPDEVPLYADPLRIHQVLSNLVSNAIKYSSEGDAIEVAVGCENGEVVVSVTDQGIGISDEDQKHVFEPFKRVGLAKEVVPGAGLGLFVVREIVRAHEGRIELVSAPGRGTTVRVHLPIGDQGPQAARPRAAQVEANREQLFVDCAERM